MGANTAIQNSAGETPRDVARRFAQLAAIKVLGGDPLKDEDEAGDGSGIGDFADPPYGSTEARDGVELTEQQIQEAQGRAKKKVEDLERLLELAKANYKQLGGTLDDKEKQRLREIREKDR